MIKNSEGITAHDLIAGIFWLFIAILFVFWLTNDANGDDAPTDTKTELEKAEELFESLDGKVVKLPESFKIDDFSRLRIQNLFTQIRLLQAQIQGLQTDMVKITNDILWERFIKTDAEKYEYRHNTGIFALKAIIPSGKGEK